MQSIQRKKEEIEIMRAITLESFDSDPTLQEIPTPQIAPNEVLVRVSASSVNPVDNSIVSGMLKDMVELIAVPESVATRKPEGVDTASAGAAPLAAITALAAMDALGVSEGDTVLIVGANGGVGSFAAQLADEAGATVIAPALPEDEEYLRELGVSEVLDRGADVAALEPGKPQGAGLRL